MVLWLHLTEDGFSKPSLSPVFRFDGDFDKARVSCGSWSVETENMVDQAQKAMEFVAEDKCNIWLQPYGSNRSLTKDEVDGAQSLLAVNRIVERMIKKDLVALDTLSLYPPSWSYSF